MTPIVLDANSLNNGDKALKVQRFSGGGIFGGISKNCLLRSHIS
jgi:hypothetical protein